MARLIFNSQTSGRKSDAHRHDLHEMSSARVIASDVMGVSTGSGSDRIIASQVICRPGDGSSLGFRLAGSTYEFDQVFRLSTRNIMNLRNAQDAGDGFIAARANDDSIFGFYCVSRFCGSSVQKDEARVAKLLSY